MQRWRWLADKTHGAVPVMSIGNGKLKSWPVNGNELIIPFDRNEQDLRALHEDSLVERGHDDMIRMGDISEFSLLHNLRVRYALDIIYSNVGPILVCVNPFKLIPGCYSKEMLRNYHGGNLDKLAPHIFAVAERAYDAMMKERCNQSMVISGESGAGKTEATKQILQYLAAIVTTITKHSSLSTIISERLLEVSPVVEAFGNAKTVRNNNSSRFGKWIEIGFSVGGEIVEGSVTDYLLEKSRIVKQANGERNFHIFYQIHCFDVKQKNEWTLSTPDKFHYLNQSGVMVAKGIEDEKDLQVLRKALGVIGIEDSVQLQMFGTIAAILHMGNIVFNETQHMGQMKIEISQNQVDIASKLLGVSPYALSRALLLRTMTAARTSTYEIPRTCEQAIEIRDAFCKMIYAAIFQWVITAINASMQSSNEASPQNIIGILDIFGFEDFQENSFEQFCINLANEKLQQLFNSFVFKLELLEYEKEGVQMKATFSYVDNQMTLDLLEGPRGVLQSLDEECKIPKGTDQNFITKLHTSFDKKHPAYRSHRLERDVFAITHYAGLVSYRNTGWLEKNKDTIHDDLLSLIKSSHSPFVKKIFEKLQVETSPSSSSSRSQEQTAKAIMKKPATVGNRFREQLSLLMTTINKGSPHFIRCIKPNHVQEPNSFQGAFVMAQLTYTGMMAACEIRRKGFPIRIPISDFVFQYSVLCPKSISISSAEGATALLRSLGISTSAFCYARTKVFFKDEEYLQLQKAWNAKISELVKKVQRNVRRWRCKNLVLRLRCCQVIQLRIRVRFAYVDTIQKLCIQKLESAKESHHLKHLDDAITFCEARSFKHPMLEEAMVQHQLLKTAEQLEQALTSKNVESIRSLLESLRMLQQFSSPVEKINNLANSAEKWLSDHEAEEMATRATASLTTAMEEKNLGKMKSALELCTKWNISFPAVECCRSLLPKLQKTLAELLNACNALKRNGNRNGQVDLVNELLGQSRQIQLETYIEGKEAVLAAESLVQTVLEEAERRRIEKLQEQAVLIEKLQQSVDSRDSQSILTLSNAAIQLDLGSNAQVIEAQEILEKITTIVGLLQQTIDSDDIEEMTLMLDHAQSMELERNTAYAVLMNQVQASLANAKEKLNKRKRNAMDGLLAAMQQCNEQAIGTVLTELEQLQCRDFADSVRGQEFLSALKQLNRISESSTKEEMQQAILVAEDVGFRTFAGQHILSRVESMLNAVLQREKEQLEQLQRHREGTRVGMNRLLFENAVSIQDESEILKLLTTADSLKIGDEPIFIQAKVILSTLQKQVCRNRIEEALKGGNLQNIRMTIDQAANIGCKFEHAEMTLKAFELASNTLTSALNLNEQYRLSDAMRTAADSGFAKTNEGKQLIIKARKFEKRSKKIFSKREGEKNCLAATSVAEQMIIDNALLELDTAMRAKDEKLIRNAIFHLMEIGVSHHPRIQDAQLLLDCILTLEKIDAVDDPQQIEEILDAAYEQGFFENAHRLIFNALSHYYKVVQESSPNSSPLRIEDKYWNKNMATAWTDFRKRLDTARALAPVLIENKDLPAMEAMAAEFSMLGVSEDDETFTMVQTAIEKIRPIGQQLREALQSENPELITAALEAEDELGIVDTRVVVAAKVLLRLLERRRGSKVLFIPAVTARSNCISSSLYEAMVLGPVYGKLGQVLQHASTETLHTALLCAIQTNMETDVVSCILDAKANINAIDEFGLSVLHHAALASEPNMLTFLLQHEDSALPNVQTPYDLVTPLHMLVRKRPRIRKAKIGACIQVFLEQGADMNIPDRDGWTVLHEISDDPILVNLIFEHSKDQVQVTAKDIAGNTALHYAAHDGQRGSILSLMSANADPNQPNHVGTTPAMIMACHTQHSKQYALLYGYGKSSPVTSPTKI